MFVLPELPYAPDALSPFVSGDTLRTHHGKHHKAYVDKTNELAPKAGLGDRPLEEVVREARGRNETKLFNNAAQAWNHAFFWRSMRPPQTGASAPQGALGDAVRQFGGLDALRTAFVDEGVNHFASGWVWLVVQGGALKVISTHDADDTLVHEDVTPVLVCDLWEHAYYLDYKNDRKGFLERWFDNVANWDFAAEQFDAVQGRGEGFRYPQSAQSRAA